MALYLFSLALLAGLLMLAWLLAWKVSEAAIVAGEQWGVLSHVSGRSSHERPTSRLGGIGLASGFFIPSAILLLVSWFQPHLEAGWGGNLKLLGWIMAGAGTMMVVGLADDVWDLPAPVKLAGQAIGALMLVPADLRFLDLEFVPVPSASPAAVMMVLTLLWVIFFVNAFNFMDGMDGFAARFTMSACAWIFGAGIFKSIGLMKGQGMALTELRLEFLIVPVLGAAAGGFHRVNRPPARVFMGDSGSHLLGFLLAVFVVLGDGEYFIARPGWPEPGPTIPAGAMWIILLPFIFDPVLTLVRRARLGENLFAAHRGHLYQRLMIQGWSHQEVLRTNIRLFRACGALGFLFAILPWALARLVVGVVALGVMLRYWRMVLRVERESGAGPGGA